MTLPPLQTLIIVCMVTLGTVITRFLSFVLFGKDKANNHYIAYFGQVLPFAVIGMLVVYCLKGTNLLIPSLVLPEAAAIVCIVVLHYWKNNALLSIGAGTAIYMTIIHLVR